VREREWFKACVYVFVCFLCLNARRVELGKTESNQQWQKENACIASWLSNNHKINSFLTPGCFESTQSLSQSAESFHPSFQGATCQRAGPGDKNPLHEGHLEQGLQQRDA
jgi:hypothetical protein